MHSSFPRKDEGYLHRPTIQNATRHWINRITRAFQSNTRLAVVAIFAFLLVTILYCGITRSAKGPAPVVLVIVLEQTDSSGEDIRIVDRVLENRLEYANAHGTQFGSL